MLAVSASALLSGCRQKVDPGALLQGIHDDYLHGSLQLARERAGRARTDFSPTGPQPDPNWALQFRLLEAELLLVQGRPGDAIAILNAPGFPIPAHGDAAIRYNMLRGWAHAGLNDLATSERELEDARGLAETSHSALLADVLRNEAHLAEDAGHTDQADQKFRDSLALARRSGNAFLQASDLIDIGVDSFDGGHLDESLGLLREAADIAQAAQMRRQLQLASGNMGWAYANLGDFERALAQFEQAEQLARELGLTRNRARWLQDAGLVEYRLGDLNAARQYEERALQELLTLSAGIEPDRVTYVEINLALLLREQGQDAAAQRYADAAALKSRESKDKNVAAYVQFVQALIAERGGATEDVAQHLTTARDLATDADLQTDIETALANLYASRDLPEKAQRWYGRAIETFERKRSAEPDESLRLAAFGFGATVYRDYADFLIREQRSNEALQVLDGSRARTLEDGLGLPGNESQTRDRNASDPQSVARKLGATVLFYSLGPRQSYLWAVTAQETRIFTLPAARDIESHVAEYQKAILKSDDPVRAATPAAAWLFETLVRPAAALIPVRSRVFLVPDGVLHTLNFETLLEPTESGPRFWIEDVTVTSASSIRMLAHNKNAVAAVAARELLLIGNPLAAVSEFEALPNAGNEIARIQSHFAADTQTVLTQAQAVPSAYAQSGPDQYRYIHFVAHGTASRLSPLDSAVVLSPQPNHPDDFKLYARDILQHPLHAELVTISTCYGSGVRAYAGEGLVGLAWVFLRAGSHHVIGALWQADDTSTPQLMDQLYAGLKSGKAPDVALREAKLSLIHSASVYRKPFYWAPFQLYAGS